MVGEESDRADSLGVCDSTETERRPLSSWLREENNGDTCSSVYAGLSLECGGSVILARNACGILKPFFALLLMATGLSTSCALTGRSFGCRLPTERCATDTVSQTDFLATINEMNRREAGLEKTPRAWKSERNSPIDNMFAYSRSSFREEEENRRRSMADKVAHDGLNERVHYSVLSEKHVSGKATKKRGRPRKNESYDDSGKVLVEEEVLETTDVKRGKVLVKEEVLETTDVKRGNHDSVKMLVKKEVPETTDVNRGNHDSVKMLVKKEVPKTTDVNRGSWSVRKAGKVDKYNLQKYYTTELLSPSEEYSLGMKVRFMVLCEEVHHGLVVHLKRTPSILEWAQACGFEEEDERICCPDYKESSVEASIRPLDSGSDLQWNQFVGKSLAADTGPGRGRGRAKKTPAISLADYLDDTALKFPKLAESAPSPYTPVNRGSPEKFLETMLECKEAKQRMVECNMRLVVSIARRYHNAGVGIQDLVQEGSLGLMRATEKFQPKKGFKFSTYASWWIQQAVFRSIAYHSRTIRLPVHVHNFLNRVRRIKTHMHQHLGRTPTNEEIARQLHMTPNKYTKLLTLTKRTISLEMPKYQNNPKDLGHESEASLGDTIDSNQAINHDYSPEQNLDQHLFQTDLYKMLQILGDDEKQVITLRYGLQDGLTRTVTAVAMQMRQTKSWVRSQECRALRKLRRPWYEKRLKEHQHSITTT